MKMIKAVRSFFFGSLARGFISSYFLFMMVGAILLSLPLSLQENQTIHFLDALFISASGLSTTGLSPMVVKDVFNRFGQTILILIIQFGGVGLIMGVALFWLVIRQKITFRQRNMIMTDQNQISREGIVRFVKNIISMIFLIEFLGFVLMTIHLTVQGYFPLTEALYQAMFTTISLFTNAGFDIAPNADSFMMYRDDYFMLTLGMFLMFMGAVGFWPLVELKSWIEAKWHREKFRFSLFSKVLFKLHIGLWMISALIVFLIERDAFLTQVSSFWDGLYVVLFMSLTTRNAGFSTISINELSEGTNVLFMFLMFLGSSPNSAGGGIRTVTLLVSLLGIRAFMRGRSDVVMKERTIKQETVFKAMLVIIVSFLWVGFITQIIVILEPFTFKEILFEVMSAFGTTGLSLGITAQLSYASKALLVLMMFVGRVGVLSLLLMFKPQKDYSSNIKFPEMDVIVG